LFVQVSETTDKWIIVFENKKTIIKVKRCDYLEHNKFMELNSKYLERIEKVKEYRIWETKTKYENAVH